MDSTVKIEEVPFGGWQRNLRLANDQIELIVTLEVGPRVLHLAPTGGRNLFCVFEADLGGSGESTWQSRGGHRLWVAPESAETDPFTYYADNVPVAYEATANGAIFRAPEEAANGWRKELEVTLQGSSVEVVHRLIGTTGAKRECAPWALSVMAAGGIAIVPQPPLGSHPENLLPNRGLVLWPYTDLTDPRLTLGSRYWTLAQNTGMGPIKIGLNHGGGTDGQGTGSWAAYALEGVLFVKQFARDPGAAYPDGGCNCELFSNEAMLEVETLGPLAQLPAGGVLEHRESWQVLTGLVGFDADDEDTIAAALGRIGL